MRHLAVLLLVCGCSESGVRRDSARFSDYRDECKERLLAQADGPSASGRTSDRTFKIDLCGVAAPWRLAEFRAAWHQPPQTQGLTGHCWAWSATSFLESEAHRLSGRPLRLSESWAVYWEFVEKARAAVRRRSVRVEGSRS